MAHPPSGGSISADVGEGLVVVTIRSAERNLLYGLVHNEVLREQHKKGHRGRRVSQQVQYMKSHPTWFCLLTLLYTFPQTKLLLHGVWIIYDDVKSSSQHFQAGSFFFSSELHCITAQEEMSTHG